MKIAVVAAICSTLMILAFFAGSIYGQGGILRGKRYLVTEPLLFASGSPQEEIAMIPAGATLYEHKTFGETSQYALFVEMKELTPLKEIPRTRNLETIPSSVYPKSE